MEGDSYFGKDKKYHLIGSMVLVMAVYFVYWAVGASGVINLNVDSYIITLVICLLKEAFLDDFISMKDMVVNALGASVVFLM